MSSVVVDTDVVSFVFKNHPIGTLYDADLAGNNLVISFMTLAELDRWAIQAKWGPLAATGCGYTWAHSLSCHTRETFARNGSEVTVAAQTKGRYCPALRSPTGHS